MEKHSKTQKTKFLIFNYPPNTYSFQNQISRPSGINGKQMFRSKDSEFSKVILPVVDAKEEPADSLKVSCTGKIYFHNKLKNQKKNQGDVHDGELYKKDGKARKSLMILKILMGIALGSKKGRKSGNQSKFVCASSNIVPISMELQPRREINLWVRRNAASPPPLQV